MKPLMIGCGVVLALGVVGGGVIAAQSVAHPSPDAAFVAQMPHTLTAERGIAMAHTACDDLATAAAQGDPYLLSDQFATALDAADFKQLVRAAVRVYCPDMAHAAAPILTAVEPGGAG